MNGVLADTSFLITLSNPARPNHLVAKRYFYELINRQVIMYLSSVVVSEYEVKQRIEDLGLHNFVGIPFNIDHAKVAGALMRPALASRPPDYPRNTVKDDLKLLAQCQVAGISHFLTDDNNCVTNIESLRKSSGIESLPFGIFCGDAFSEDWFNPGNQGALIES